MWWAGEGAARGGGAWRWRGAGGGVGGLCPPPMHPRPPTHPPTPTQPPTRARAQAASGAGQAAMEELEQQTREALDGACASSFLRFLRCFSLPLSRAPGSSTRARACGGSLASGPRFASRPPPRPPAPPPALLLGITPTTTIHSTHPLPCRQARDHEHLPLPVRLQPLLPQLPHDRQWLQRGGDEDGECLGGGGRGGGGWVSEGRRGACAASPTHPAHPPTRPPPSPRTLAPTPIHPPTRAQVKETRKIWGDEGVAITATCIRVPVMRAHAESINLEFERDVSGGCTWVGG